jgi:hypothetical protein
LGKTTIAATTERGGELQDAVDQKSATVVERDGQITGYATAIGFFAHCVARSNQDLIALIAGASEFTGPGFLLLTRNYEVFAWFLTNGLRLIAPMTLMTTGLCVWRLLIKLAACRRCVRREGLTKPCSGPQYAGLGPTTTMC